MLFSWTFICLAWFLLLLWSYGSRRRNRVHLMEVATNTNTRACIYMYILVVLLYWQHENEKGSWTSAKDIDMKKYMDEYIVCLLSFFDTLHRTCNTCHVITCAHTAYIREYRIPVVLVFSQRTYSWGCTLFGRSRCFGGFDFYNFLLLLQFMFSVSFGNSILYRCVCICLYARRWYSSSHLCWPARHQFCSWCGSCFAFVCV